MKSVLLRTIFYTLFTAIVAFGGLTLSQAAVRNNDRQRIEVETLSLPNSSLSFDFATVTNVDNKNVLTFSNTNKTNVQVTSIEVAAFTINTEGEIVGGQGIVLNTNLASNKSESNSMTLTNKFNDGDKLVLAAWSVGDSTGKIFDRAPVELVKLVKLHVKGQLKSYLQTQNFTMLNVSNQRNLQESYCDRHQRLAEVACKCGMSSFSCTENSSYSFSCNAPNANCKTPEQPE